MDTKQLSSHFKIHHRLDISCWWRYISQPNGKNLPKAERPKALHFKVDVQQHARAKQLLFQTYGTSNTATSHFPCGYRMRFCPEIMNATSSQLPSVYTVLNQQKQFLLMVSTYQHYWGGNLLDHVHPLLQRSLRQLLAEAAPRDQTTNKTFLAIQSSSGVIRVDFLQPNEARVREILSGLVPYAKHHFYHQHPPGTDVEMDRDPEKIAAATESLFSPADLQAAHGFKWCPTQDSIITEQDSYLFAIASDNDNMFDLSGMDIPPSAPPQPLTPREAHIMNLVQGTGDDSVATF
jgi:hypothetical protein